MRTIVVQTTGPGQKIAELWPGQSITFGRGSSRHPVDLELDDLAISRFAGTISAVEDFWTLSNYSARSTYIVENPEGGGEYLKIPPGRVGAPVPFEISSVLLRRGAPVLTVMAPEHLYSDGRDQHGSGERTVQPQSLDHSAKYFLVLVALCEPRLLDPSSPLIPTVPEILARLGRPDLTRGAVNFHIEYLASTKIRVKEPSHRRADWQRAALVNVALRFDLVREEHLTLLPRR